MILRKIVNNVEVEIDLSGVSERDYECIEEVLRNGLADDQVKNREVIHDAYMNALNLCPQANASDLWHHVVYRL